MAFNIPNEIDAFNPNQAEPDAVDVAILVAAFAGNGVYAGCAVTAQGSPDMTVAVAAGLIRYADKSVVVAAGNVTITTANATNPRIDLVVVDNTGAKSATAGTAAASPVCPAIPASSIVLAMVYVPANDTTMATNQITDKRVLLPAGLPVIRYKAANEIVNASAAFQDDDDLAFAADANSIWEVELTLVYTTGTTPDLKIQFTLPAGATMLWGPISSRASTTTGDLMWGLNALAAGSATPTLSIESTAMTIGGSGTSINAGTRLYGLVYLSSTAGTVQLQWAQNTSNASDSTMLKGSTLIARRLGT